MLDSSLEHYPPWTLHAWPPLLWQVGKRIPLRLQHLGTQVTSAGDNPSCAVGQTLWAWRSRDGDLGVAWDWVRLTPGLVALADPMAVVSNLRLVDDGGDMLTAFESARHFNAIVHALSWQDAVERVLNSPGLPSPPSPSHAAPHGRSVRRHALTQ